MRRFIRVNQFDTLVSGELRGLFEIELGIPWHTEHLHGGSVAPGNEGLEYTIRLGPNLRGNSHHRVIDTRCVKNPGNDNRASRKTATWHRAHTKNLYGV